MKTAEYWVQCWIDYSDMAARNDELAVLGASIAGMLVDFRGEVPRGSGFKHETVSARAEKLRTISRDFRMACHVMAALSNEEFSAAVEWVFLKDRNPMDAEKRIKSRKDAYSYLRGQDENFEDWNRAVNRAFDKINAHSC